MVAVLFAAAGGAVWATQFAPESHPVASWGALAPLVLLLGLPRPGLLAWIHGSVSWLVAIPWIVPTLVRFGHLSTGLSWVLLVLLCGYLGSYTAVFGWLGARIWRRGSAGLAMVVLPALWVALEWVREWLFSGFPWNLAAYAWVDVIGALPTSALVGPWGVSFLLVTANVGLAFGLARRRFAPPAFGILGVLLVLVLAGRFAPDLAVHTRDAQPVRLLQPNLPLLEDPYDPAVAESYARVLAMSRRACDVPGALVVWPESAGWPYSWARHASFRADLEALLAAGCPLLLNSVADEPDGPRNAAYLLSPDATVARADKRHLVPFGEYVPLAGIVPLVDSLARQAGDFVPGNEVALLDWGRERLGLSICFEIVFPAEVAEAVDEGATTLVTITNDAWYGDSWAPWQHFRAARFRAAETRRPLLRAALTGISALVRPDGSVAALLGPFEEGILRGRLVGREGRTPYVRAPWAPPAAAVLLALVGLLLAWRRGNEAPPRGRSGNIHERGAEP